MTLSHCDSHCGLITLTAMVLWWHYESWCFDTTSHGALMTHLDRCDVLMTCHDRERTLWYHKVTVDLEKNGPREYALGMWECPQEARDWGTGPWGWGSVPSLTVGGSQRKCANPNYAQSSWQSTRVAKMSSACMTAQVSPACMSAHVKSLQGSTQ